MSAPIFMYEQLENLLSQHTLNKFHFFCLAYLDRPHVKADCNSRFLTFDPLKNRKLSKQSAGINPKNKLELYREGYENYVTTGIWHPIININENQQRGFDKVSEALRLDIASILNLKAGEVSTDFPRHFLRNGYLGWHRQGDVGYTAELSFSERTGREGSYLGLCHNGEFEFLEDRRISLNIYPKTYFSCIDSMNSNRISLYYSFQERK